jgi:energy-coupling factor transporter transmembrane protein EcfT
MRNVRQPGLILGAGLAAALAAALAPVGLGRAATPMASWILWGGVLACALVAMRLAGLGLARTLTRLLWLLPLILLLALPAAFFAAADRRADVVLGLAARAFAAASVGVALAAWLGPAGFVEGLRRLRAPERLVEIMAAALASLILVTRQVRAMLRAREARRPGYGAWSSLARSPSRTVRGFGRLVAALLLRSLERAECLDRARRARGAGE